MARWGCRCVVASCGCWASKSDGVVSLCYTDMARLDWRGPAVSMLVESLCAISLGTA